MIFQDKPRSRETPGGESEPMWDVLDSSGGPMSDAIRALLEDWFSHYPPEARADWLGSFQSGNDVQLRAATFELYVHELLLRLGYSVTVHPSLPSENKRSPDFHAMDSGGQGVYVEATIAGVGSVEQQSAARRERSALDELNKIETPDFFIGVESMSPPQFPPKTRRLRTRIEGWLSSLDPDSATDLHGKRLRDLPERKFQGDGWDITVTAFPKKPEFRGSATDRPVACVFRGVSRNTDTEDLRNSILDKAGRYGDPGEPFVVAVSPVSFAVTGDSVADALFGQEVYTIGEGAAQRHLRLANGVWRSRAGTRYTRLSAVLVVNDIQPWTLGVREARLWRNPDARRPVGGSLVRIPGFQVVDGRLEDVSGVDAAELLGIAGFLGL